MTTETRSPTVASYLGRLDEASRLLPDDLRAELVGQVREHLTELERSGLDDVGLRMALERFGTPEQLVTAEAEQAGLVLVPLGTATPKSTTTVAPDRPAWSGLDRCAVLLVLVGGFVVPVIAPVVGMVLAWLSPRWSRRTKIGATLVFCAPPVVVGAGLPLQLATNAWSMRTPQSDDPFWTQTGAPVLAQASGSLTVGLLALVVLSLLAWLVVGLWLAFSGRRLRP